MARHCSGRSRKFSSRFPFSSRSVCDSSAIAMAARTATRTESTVCVAAATAPIFSSTYPDYWLCSAYFSQSVVGRSVPNIQEEKFSALPTSRAQFLHREHAQRSRCYPERSSRYCAPLTDADNYNPRELSVCLALHSTCGLFHVERQTC